SWGGGWELGGDFPPPRISDPCRLKSEILLYHLARFGWANPGNPNGVIFCRKQCIEQEQQFDFLKDLVASVPDMQGDAEDNHMEGGEKVSRRGRKPGSGRRNGGTAGKGKDPKQSGTDSEQDVSWRQNVAFSQVWLSGVCAMQSKTYSGLKTDDARNIIFP
uniref:Uncharacterized protein n=1 Tax=Naja naja TaxID=35670 RepID=A0A8C6X424_NAJNA